MIVVFYCLATGIRVLVTQLDPGESPRQPRPGEGRMDIDQAVFDAWLTQWKGPGDRHPIQEYINSKTGMTPTLQYAIVQGGVVVNVMGDISPILHADNIAREVAAVPGAQAIPCVGVAPGATYLNGVFTNLQDPVTVKGVSLGN